MSSDSQPPRPFKIWSCDRKIKKAVVVSSFDELKEKGSQKLSYDNVSELVVVLDTDGTEVEDDIYFNTLEKGTVLQLLRPDEKWFSSGVPVEHYPADSYGIQIRNVTSAAQRQGNTSRSRPTPNVKDVTSPRVTIYRHIEQEIPDTTSPLFNLSDKESSYDDDDNDEFFVEPAKEVVCESPKSIHYFRDLAIGEKKQQASTNFSPVKSKLETACRTSKRLRAIKDDRLHAVEDAVASDNISSDLPQGTTPSHVSRYDERVYWSHAATQQLIRSYICYRPDFKLPKGQVGAVWKLVAKKMQFHGFMVSAKTCDKKWRNLKMTYKTITKKMNLGSIKTRKSWQYYGLMREAMTRPARQLRESDACGDCDMDCDWLAEFFKQRKEQEIQELEEIRRASHHTIEQLRKENESLQLLNDYLASCVTK